MQRRQQQQQQQQQQLAAMRDRIREAEIAPLKHYQFSVDSQKLQMCIVDDTRKCLNFRLRKGFSSLTNETNRPPDPIAAAKVSAEDGAVDGDTMCTAPRYRIAQSTMSRLLMVLLKN